MSVRIVRSLADLRGLTAQWRREGATIGVVPTMGALHEGHLSLVHTAQRRATRVIVTLFVNPKQFNSASDLAQYPRTEREDAVKLADTGADVLYVPDADSIYPPGFVTTVSVAGPSQGLDGAARPGHFDGVATVVTKLLLQTDADLAFFGEKDFQQLQVVRRLVRDLDLDVAILGCPTVREADGLAMSSRNVRLSPTERRLAPQIYAAMLVAAERIASGVPIATVLEDCRAALLAGGFGPVDYVELRGAETLAPVRSAPVEPARLLVAAWLGSTRLIDNIAVAALNRTADALLPAA
ncbi:pantoate--beta-alanine ligase [Lichenihabitans sp. Uapishka_5]|uniref:pantoate--beta-alanine ligase n=1 Tax=Lichenihabitans sp. Uapishka_5 TaxID=3037302 RepID=UPI0029E7DF55|nr:pantoate--beta-alanine ligase [Lichenihabitans sp. Uapishka_5]MDX7951598.1 pantoate--beta-alanine ligase [Lichenihabitans sp. Uapishka_5]